MLDIKIGDVAATSFVTLYCHAIESQSEDPILDDPKAVEIMNELNKILSGSKNRLVSSQPYNVVKYISYVPHIQLEGIEYEEIHRDAY